MRLLQAVTRQHQRHQAAPAALDVVVRDRCCVVWWVIVFVLAQAHVAAQRAAVLLVRCVCAVRCVYDIVVLTGRGGPARGGAGAISCVRVRCYDHCARIAGGRGGAAAGAAGAAAPAAAKVRISRCTQRAPQCVIRLPPKRAMTRRPTTRRAATATATTPKWWPPRPTQV
jgi:hypothetical protein